MATTHFRPEKPITCLFRLVTLAIVCVLMLTFALLGCSAPRKSSNLLAKDNIKFDADPDGSLLFDTATVTPSKKPLRQIIPSILQMVEDPDFQGLPQGEKLKVIEQVVARRAAQQDIFDQVAPPFTARGRWVPDGKRKEKQSVVPGQEVITCGTADKTCTEATIGFLPMGNVAILGDFAEEYYEITTWNDKTLTAIDHAICSNNYLQADFLANKLIAVDIPANNQPDLVLGGKCPKYGSNSNHLPL